MTKIYVFPGQGSQKVGMGSDLFDRFSDMEKQASEELGYSLRDLCMENPATRLNQTDYTQPALYAVNAMTYRKRVEDTGVVPDAVAGHSLGEYNALLAGEAYDFVTGLKLVRKRGELMAKIKDGGMAAVVGFTSQEVREILVKNGLDALDVANLNTHKQLVVSGPQEVIAKAKPVFDAAGASMFLTLKVSGAFHSRYMIGASDEFSRFLDRFEFRPLAIPVIANCSAMPYRDGKIKENLVRQITSSVRWVETMELLLAQDGAEVEEIGPGTVLTGMLKQISAVLSASRV